MTVTAAPSVNNHVGNGVSTVFAYGFKILQAADLKVTVNGVIVTNYTVAGVRNPSGGSITFTPAPANGAAIRIARNMAILRGTDYQFNGALPADTLNDDQDAPVMMIQQIDEKVSRAIRVPDSDAGALVELPVAAARAGRLLAFDGSGQPTAIPSVTGTAVQLALDLIASTGATLVGISRGLVASVTHTVARWLGWQAYHVYEFMTVAEINDVTNRTRTIDVYSKIIAALDAVEAIGGGELRFGRGSYRIDAALDIGNGSNTSHSTKYNKIRLVGMGRGAGDSLSNQQQNAPTEIWYNGPLSDTVAAVSFSGPMHNVGIEHMRVNANFRAGHALQLVQVTDSFFHRVECLSYRASAYRLTTRNGFPFGAPYGCANNTFLECYGYEPGANASGVIWTSGVDPAATLLGNPDTANNDFIGGVIFYSGNVNTAGLLIHGADNNNVYGTQFLAFTPNDGLGRGISWLQWAGTPDFPKQNNFYNIGLMQPMTGTPGTGGNIFFGWQGDDGAGDPVTDYTTAYCADGRVFVNGERTYKTRRISFAGIVTLQSTTSLTFVTVPGVTVTLTSVRAGTKLRISCTGRAGKLTAGTAAFRIFLNGALTGVEQLLQEAGAAGDFESIAFSKIVDAAVGSNTVDLRYLTSDANAAQISHAALTVEELV